MAENASMAYAGAYLDSVIRAYPLGNGYRWYLPTLMRFAAADSWSPFGAGGVNPYAYCGADPINHSDPSGHVLDFWLGLEFDLGRTVPRQAAGDAPIGADRAVRNSAAGADGAAPGTSRAGQAGANAAGNAPGNPSGGGNGAAPRRAPKRPAASGGGGGDAGAPAAKQQATVPTNPEHFDIGAFMAQELSQGHLRWHPEGSGNVAATWQSPMSRLPYPAVVSERIFNRVGFVMDASRAGAADTFSLRRIDTSGLDMQVVYSGTSAGSLLEQLEPVSAPRLYDPRYDNREFPRLLSQAQLSDAFAQAFADRLAQWNSELPTLDLGPNDFS